MPDGSRTVSVEPIGFAVRTDGTLAILEGKPGASRPRMLIPPPDGALVVYNAMCDYAELLFEQTYGRRPEGHAEYGAAIGSWIRSTQAAHENDLERRHDV